MAIIRPFRALRYNEKKIALSKVVAPPYDVISNAQAEALHRKNPHNIIRLILGKSLPKDSALNNKYSRAKALLENWLKNSVLIQDKAPSIYIYEQKYSHKGEIKKRHGFICLMKLEDLNKQVVFGHEHTFDKPKEDRFNLLQATNANLSPVFALFSDKERKIENLIKNSARQKPIININFDGVTEKLWAVSDKKIISRLERLIKNKQVFIADGHHRYEAALAYRNLKRKEKKEMPSDYIMMYLCSLENKGLTILSTHRMLKNISKEKLKALFKSLEKFFEIQKVKNKDELFSKMTKFEKSDKRHIFGLYTREKKFFLLLLKDESVLERSAFSRFSKAYNRLDAAILHNLIFSRIIGLDPKKDLEKIGFERDEDLIIKLVNKKKFQLGFFLNPVKISQVRDIAIALDRMPHKSTYFYPKLLSGLVINKFYYTPACRRQGLTQINITDEHR